MTQEMFERAVQGESYALRKVLDPYKTKEMC